jgi:hypothetical protein
MDKIKHSRLLLAGAALLFASYIGSLAQDVQKREPKIYPSRINLKRPQKRVPVFPNRIIPRYPSRYRYVAPDRMNPEKISRYPYPVPGRILPKNPPAYGYPLLGIINMRKAPGTNFSVYKRTNPNEPSSYDYISSRTRKPESTKPWTKMSVEEAFRQIEDAYNRRASETDIFQNGRLGRECIQICPGRQGSHSNPGEHESGGTDSYNFWDYKTRRNIGIYQRHKNCCLFEPAQQNAQY